MSHGLTGWPRRPPQWVYLAGSVAALDYFHDAWFYWTHRALHSRLLFRHVHYLHHRRALRRPPS